MKLCQGRIQNVFSILQVHHSTMYNNQNTFSLIFEKRLITKVGNVEQYKHSCLWIQIFTPPFCIFNLIYLKEEKNKCWIFYISIPSYVTQVHGFLPLWMQEKAFCSQVGSSIFQHIQRYNHYAAQCVYNTSLLFFAYWHQNKNQSPGILPLEPH